MSATTREVMESRIRRLLELERMSGDVQAALRQRGRSLAMPKMADELLEELDGLDSPEDHPDFVEFVAGQPLIEREGFAVDKYRSLRYRMGSEGPCCHRKYLHSMLADVEDVGDLKYVRKGVESAFNRHMRFSLTTALEVVKACARAGSPAHAFPLVLPGACEQWRLPVDGGTVLSQLMLELEVAKDWEGMQALLEAQVKAARSEYALVGRALYYYVRGMATAGDVDRVMRGLLLCRRQFGSVSLSLWKVAAPCLIEHWDDVDTSSSNSKRRAWRVFGNLASVCGDQALQLGLAYDLYAVNPRRREVARAKDPSAVAKVAEALPQRLAEAFETMAATVEPHAWLASRFEQEASQFLDSATNDDNAEEEEAAGGAGEAAEQEAGAEANDDEDGAKEEAESGGGDEDKEDKEAKEDKEEETVEPKEQ